MGLVGGVISVRFLLSRRPSTRSGSFLIELVQIVLPSELEISFESKMGLMVETVYVFGWVPTTPTHHAPGTQCVFTGACLRSCKLLLLFGLRLCVFLALGRGGGGGAWYPLVVRRADIVPFPAYALCCKGQLVTWFPSEGYRLFVSFCADRQ